ncbi:MAG: hypothetical protein ACI4WV_01995, partial [Eubacteriales bacterium]
MSAGGRRSVKVRGRRGWASCIAGVLFPVADEAEGKDGGREVTGDEGLGAHLSGHVKRDGEAIGHAPSFACHLHAHSSIWGETGEHDWKV